VTFPDTPPAGPEPGLARAAVAVVGTRVTLLVLGTATSVIIARTLGPAGRGEYAFVIAVAAIAVAVAHLSVEQAQVYLVSVGRDVRSLASNAVPLALGLGVLAVGAVITSALLFDYPSSHPFHDTNLLLALAAVPMSILVLFTNSLLVLSGRINALNRSALIAGVVQSALVGIFVLLDRLTVTTVVLVWLLNASLPLFVSLPVLRLRLKSISWSVARQELGLGLRYHTGMASLYLLLRVDVLLLAALRSDREVGLYALAVTLVELTNVATDAIATVVMKRQAHLALADAAELTARVVGLTVVLAVVVSTGLVLASPLLIPLVYGSDFRGTVPAIFALAPGVLALVATRSAGGYLIRLNRPWVVTSLNVGALAVNVAANLALIPILGIVGAGLASSLAYVLLACAYLGWLSRAAGLGASQFTAGLVPRRLSSALRAPRSSDSPGQDGGEGA
jgi:O-antigen/teichoic acid export membrane protein